MKRHLLFATIIFFIVVLTASAFQATDPPKPFTGKVVAIADGDTITVILDRKQHKIRLEGIDAPESGQAFGTKAKQALGDAVFGKEVRVDWKSRDKYQRILGHVYVDGKHVNLDLVQQGFAWHFTKYSSDQALAAAEKSAREAKRGLWADAKPIPPWDYRKGETGEPKIPGIVYVTSSGKTYHNPGCKFLAKSKIEISLDKARGLYKACSLCKPEK